MTLPMVQDPSNPPSRSLLGLSNLTLTPQHLGQGPDTQQVQLTQQLLVDNPPQLGILKCQIPRLIVTVNRGGGGKG